MNMRNTFAKAQIINAKTSNNWQESLQLAAKANRTNKTKMVIDAVNKNGTLHIDKAMAMTGLNKNNLQSRFRRDKIYVNKVYYDRSIHSFRHVA